MNGRVKLIPNNRPEIVKKLDIKTVLTRGLTCGKIIDGTINFLFSDRSNEIGCISIENMGEIPRKSVDNVYWTSREGSPEILILNEKHILNARMIRMNITIRINHLGDSINQRVNASGRMEKTSILVTILNPCQVSALSPTDVTLRLKSN